jgi:hypothetical protein
MIEKAVGNYEEFFAKRFLKVGDKVIEAAKI